MTAAAPSLELRKIADELERTTRLGLQTTDAYVAVCKVAAESIRAALQADPVAGLRVACTELTHGREPTPPPTELQADRADRVDVALMTATIDSLRTRLASCETALETAYAESSALQADRGAVSPRAIDALTIYRQQADADGVMVMVSRQALDELLAAYTPQGDVSVAIDGPDYFDGCSLNGYVGGCERMGCHTAAPAAVSAGFGMDDEQVAALLEASLKPEEIGGDAVIRHKRVVELLHWFARLTRGHANPKWTTSHACELAYYIATAPKPTDEAPAKGLMDGWSAGWQARAYTAAPAAVMPEEIDPESPNFIQGMSVGRAESEMLCRLIADPKCERCGARNEAEAETMCRPSDCSCPGTEWPLVNLWALSKPTDEAPAKGDDRYLELIYAVGNKYPGESRHETALRYIRQAEQHGDEHACTDATSQDSPT